MKILVVVDMQNDFIDGALGTPEAVGIVPHVVEKIRNWEGLVYATQDTHSAGYLETQEGRILPVPHCIEGTPGWQLADSVFAALQERQEVRRLRKPAFGSRDLGEELEKLNRTSPVEEIELVGLCTDICVISNALLLKAFLPEVPVAVDASRCAGVTPESHQNALNAMKMCQITIRNE
ncbi:MAG: cysteine hydrolase [Oscillospiraceae bacterium]|nr:cysteine hydrolase [Oscillospiraceae bacterium]